MGGARTDRLDSAFRWIGGGCGDPTSAGRRHVSRRGGSRSRRWLPENETRRDETIESIRGVIAIQDEMRKEKLEKFRSFLLYVFIYIIERIYREMCIVERLKKEENKGVERKREIHAVLIFKSSKNSIPVFFVERRIDCTCFSFRSSGWFPNIFSLAGRIV